jgi:hypothetical protein
MVVVVSYIGGRHSFLMPAYIQMGINFIRLEIKETANLPNFFTGSAL